MLINNLVHDFALHYLRQRLLEVYGPNLYTALLVGARARGATSRNSPYDVFLYLKQMKEKRAECDNASLIQTEMLETFDAVFNIFPFSGGEYLNDTVLMRTVRSVGVPIVAVPIEFKLNAVEQVDGFPDGKEMICVQAFQQPSGGGVAIHEVHTVSVRTGESKSWSILLPNGDENEMDQVAPAVDSDTRCEDLGDNTFEDPVLFTAATELYTHLQKKRVVSRHPDEISSMLALVYSTYGYELKRYRLGRIFGQIEDYNDVVWDVAKAIKPSTPETLLCRAELDAVPDTCQDASIQNGAEADAQHEAKILRTLLGFE